MSQKTPLILHTLTETCAALEYGIFLDTVVAIYRHGRNDVMCIVFIDNNNFIVIITMLCN